MPAKKNKSVKKTAQKKSEVKKTKKLTIKKEKTTEKKSIKKQDKNSVKNKVSNKTKKDKKQFDTNPVKIKKEEIVTAVERKEIKTNLSHKKTNESKSKLFFKVGDYAIYPSHGVGKIIDIEKSEVLGQEFQCYLMFFEKEKLTIKIPTNSAEKIGLRHLVSKDQMEEVFSTLRSGIKKLKGMWSRRAQEYETKINSGDIMLLAEVLRDLTRDIEDGDRSYSERIIYETAVNRLAAEYSVIYGITFEEAKDKVITTAKDKLGIEGKVSQKDEFDEFDYDIEDSERDEDEDEEDDEDDEDEDDEMYDEDDDEDERPKKRRTRG